MDKKVERIINLYNRLNDGEILIKADEASRFGVNERSIQRDLDDIRAYFANDMESNRELVYDRSKKGYVLVQNQKKSLTNSEILTVCKILLESRSLTKEEMYPIIDKLLQCCVPYKNYRQVAELISNEKFHYLEPHHGRKFVDDMWDISSAVYEHRLMRIRYQKLKEPDKVMRLIQPVGIMFSEYYFYLCAYISVSEEMPDVPKRPFPTIYRGHFRPFTGLIVLQNLKYWTNIFTFHMPRDSKKGNSENGFSLCSEGNSGKYSFYTKDSA